MQFQESYFKEETIIQNQNLFCIQTKDAQKILHRSIGALRILNRNKQLVNGSGVLISKNLVLTAAHNIYNRHSKEESKEIKFYLGVNGTAKQYYAVEEVKYMQEYKTCDDNQRLFFDFALLKLNKQVQFVDSLADIINKLFNSYKKQFLELSIPCQKCLIAKNKQTLVQIYGYPNNNNKNYQVHNKYGDQFTLKQYGLSKYDKIILIDHSEHIIKHGISTQPGQSGCPLVIGNDIIAIHFGSGNRRLIDIPLIGKLEEWCKQINAYPFQVNSKKICSHLQPIMKQFLKNKQIKKIKESNELNLSNNKLKLINIRQFNNLTKLRLQYNKLSTIDLKKNINLKNVYLYNNNLSTINLSQNYNLTKLYLENNKIQSIDTTQNSNLTHLFLSNNKLSSIHLCKNMKLTHLNLNNNQISSIDITKNINLVSLSLSHNKLSTINLTNNTKLIEAFIHCNYLSTFDITKNISLAQLRLQYNQLTKITLFDYDQKRKDYYLSLKFDFYQQLSDVCEVQLKYKKEDGVKCNQLKEKLVAYSFGQNLPKNSKKNKCKYIFITTESQLI